MLKQEKKYDFKRRMLKVHRENLRDASLVASANELELINGTCIVLPQEKSEVTYHAAKDFADFLLVSMGVTAAVGYAEVTSAPCIRLAFNQDLDEVSAYMGQRITVDADGILIEGYDERGLAQALYHLEEQMTFRRAPYLAEGVTKRKALFSPRYAQSPMGFMDYSDEVLSRMAHMGYDAIFTWIKNAEVGMDDNRLDLAMLCERAEKYGLDVYAVIFFEHTANPADEGAQAFYDDYYGTLFSECPKLKGIELVGEGHYFHSKDPAVRRGAGHRDNIPDPRPAAGWWPCNDYPDLIRMIQKAIKPHSPDAKILLATYNWGIAPEDLRLALIEALPDDVILMPSWDMFQVVEIADGVVEMVRDYTLSTYLPSDYYRSEAIAAQKRGMKCMLDGPMSGKTWNYGTVPYLPMPYQWIKRYKAFLKAREDWGVAGLGEDIHYGFYPSFVSDLLKHIFFTDPVPLEETLDKILVTYYGEDALEEIKRALHVWSDAITHAIPADEDQYGALRVGPAYPFWSGGRDAKYPTSPTLLFGNTIHKGKYTPRYKHEAFSLPGVRMPAEIAHMEQLRDMMLEGVRILQAIEGPNDELLRLINLGEFIYRATCTAIDVKKHFILLRRLDLEETVEGAEQILDEIEVILLREKQNVEATIPLVQVDSSLGWEPSMGYMTDEKALRWKLRQLDYELFHALPLYRKKARAADRYKNGGK